MLENLAKDEPEKYATFWTQFGAVLKEAPIEDSANNERVSKLFRFASTHNDSDTQNVSLEDYVSRMKEGQEKFITSRQKVLQRRKIVRIWKFSAKRH